MQKDIHNENLPANLQKILLDLVNKYEREDDWVRKEQIKRWKKNEEFWHGIQYIFWSEMNQEWVSPVQTTGLGMDEGRENVDGPFYDYVVNIYKAHGESVIAALSTQVPAVRFPPDDADNDDDVETSKTFAKIADLIQRHNQAKILLLRALYNLWNQGLNASYHAPKSDRAFGMYMFPEYGPGLGCEQCGENFAEGKDEEAGTDLAAGEACPTCSAGSAVDGSQQQNSNPDPTQQLPPQSPQPEQQAPQLQQKTMITGFSQSPKSRIIIENYGPLHVKIPYYARDPKKKDRPYLICTLDQPISFLKYTYPHVADKIDASFTEAGTYERMGRAPSSFGGFERTDDSRNLAPLKRCWLNKFTLAGLGKDLDTERAQLEKLFPEGIYCCFIGDVYVESRNEDADDYWTIGQAGLSSYIHSDPIGQSLIPVQELRNILVNLTIDTVEHGIPTGYADPDVLNFDTYSAHEARPGMIYPAKPKAGQTLSQAFYDSSRATLSKEVAQFEAQLDKDGQFVVGSQASIYGGTADDGSRTASEYAQSRQMALQRLSIAWVFFCDWWTRLMYKCVKLYVANMVEDERFVKQDGDNYINVWIRRAQLNGKIGEVEPEGADSFPISSAQKLDLLKMLMTLNNDFVNAALFDVENRRILADALGLPNFKIPGEAQRAKQTWETAQMLAGKPMQIEPEIDDAQIHIQDLTSFLVSAAGIEIRMTQPQVYQFLMQHLMEHKQSMAQQQVPPNQPQPQQATGAPANG